MRLIDADLLVKYFTENSNDLQGSEWFITNILDAINSAPAVSGEPVAVARVAQESFGRGNVFWYKECPPDGTDLFTAPPILEAKIAKLESKAADLDELNSTQAIYIDNHMAHIAELTAKLEKMRGALKHAISLPVDKMYLFQVNKFYVERILEECKYD